MPAADLSATGREDRAPQIVPAEVAFVVYRTPEGQIMISDDLNTALQVSRQPSLDDIYSMMATGVKNITVNQTAMATSGQIALTQAIAKQNAGGMPGMPGLDEVLKNIRKV